MSFLSVVKRLHIFVLKSSRLHLKISQNPGDVLKVYCNGTCHTLSSGILANFAPQVERKERKSPYNIIDQSSVLTEIVANDGTYGALHPEEDVFTLATS